MADLVRYGGALLRRDGALARGISCCCDVDPPPCPSCCIEITWGTFDGNGDLIDAAFTGMELRLVMPTKNSRLVCQSESIEVVIEILDPDDPPTGTPYVRWDRHWRYTSHTPIVGTDGIVIDSGLIDWGTITPIAEQYKVTLAFDHCWSDNSTQFGDLEFGMKGGEYVLATGDSCDSESCCDVVYPCDDCCWYISALVADNTAAAFELNVNGDPVFWAENMAGDRMKVIVDGTNNGVYCLGGDPITLRISLIPHEYDGNEWAAKMSVSASANWRIAGLPTPGVGTGTVVDGPDPPMSVDWGDEVTGFEYELSMEVPCPNLADATITIAFEDKYHIGGADNATVSFEWLCCSLESVDYSCDDCYPVPFPEYMHCSFDLSGSSATVVTDVDLNAFIGLNIGEWEVLAVWENYTSDGGDDPTTATNRQLHYLFKCCENCDLPNASVAFQQFVQDTYGLEYTSAIDCSTGLLPVAGETVADVIASTLGELQEPIEDPPQEIYVQEPDDGTCPECPPEVP